MDVGDCEWWFLVGDLFVCGFVWSCVSGGG